jgi:cellulose biosynthesis protein BcsQ
MLKKIIKKISAIITIASVKGGVGKSTLVLNLIIEYSKTQKVNVIDLDKNR